MKKTDNFFLIHNYNTIPDQLLKFCNKYIIYDCSSNTEIKSSLHSRNLNVIDVNNTGHNITTYFSYFAENYDSLPDFICLLKGNIIGRHCSEEFFERVYNNKYFTFLYEDKNVELRKNINFLAMENMYLEINDSWYVNSPSHPHKYFNNFNRLLKFIYKNPSIPEYCLFAPGACYIVSKYQIYKHSRTFYVNLNKLMSYGLEPSFPSEAHQIERMLPIIFAANYQENSWMNNEKEFDKKIEIEKSKLNQISTRCNSKKKIFSKLKKYIKYEKRKNE